MTTAEEVVEQLKEIERQLAAANDAIGSESTLNQFVAVGFAIDAVRQRAATYPLKDSSTPAPVIRPGVYRHYKGDLYDVLGLVRDSTNGPNDGRWLVRYFSHAKQVEHVREVFQFVEMVRWSDGQDRPRFVFERAESDAQLPKPVPLGSKLVPGPDAVRLAIASLASVEKTLGPIARTGQLSQGGEQPGNWIDVADALVQVKRANEALRAIPAQAADPDETPNVRRVLIRLAYLDHSKWGPKHWEDMRREAVSALEKLGPKPAMSKPPRYDDVYAAGVAAMDAEDRRATHRCKVCGALWWLGNVPPVGLCWSLRSPTCGRCCDNLPVEWVQLEPIPAETESERCQHFWIGESERHCSRCGFTPEEAARRAIQGQGKSTEAPNVSAKVSTYYEAQRAKVQRAHRAFHELFPFLLHSSEESFEPAAYLRMVKDHYEGRPQSGGALDLNNKCGHLFSSGVGDNACSLPEGHEQHQTRDGWTWFSHPGPGWIRDPSRKATCAEPSALNVAELVREACAKAVERDTGLVTGRVRVAASIRALDLAALLRERP